MGVLDSSCAFFKYLNYKHKVICLFLYLILISYFNFCSLRLKNQCGFRVAFKFKSLCSCDRCGFRKVGFSLLCHCFAGLGFEWVLKGYQFSFSSKFVFWWIFGLDLFDVEIVSLFRFLQHPEMFFFCYILLIVLLSLEFL